jgi:hypothetical protein
MKKETTLDAVRITRDTVGANVALMRKRLDAYKSNAKSLDSEENRRTYRPEALDAKKKDLLQKSKEAMRVIHNTIRDDLGDVLIARALWSKEYLLRMARFSPPPTGRPAPEDAKVHATLNGLLEHLSRQNVMLRASRHSDDDLAAEAEQAALRGDVATVAVYEQESRFRNKGVLRAKMDAAIAKLEIPEAVEAAKLFKEIDAGLREAEAMQTTLAQPMNAGAQGTVDYFHWKRNQTETATEEPPAAV